MTEKQSPLTRLVLFMVFVAVAGTFIAGAHFYAVDFTAQKAPQAPDNSNISCEKLLDNCQILHSVSVWKYSDCMNEFDARCGAGSDS